MPKLPPYGQVYAVWKLLGVVAYAVDVEAPFAVNTASKLIRAVMVDAGVKEPFDHEAHKAFCRAKYEAMANAGSMGNGLTRALTKEEIEAKPEYIAEQARIAKRWDEKTEGIVRIKKCYHDASYSDVPTVAPNVPNRFKMRELSITAPSGPRCFYCGHGIVVNRPVVWARLASLRAPVSYKPFRPLPPSAVCPNCVPVLNKEIAKREHKAAEQGRRAPNLVVYGYDAG